MAVSALSNHRAVWLWTLFLKGCVAEQPQHPLENWDEPLQRGDRGDGLGTLPAL